MTEKYYFWFGLMELTVFWGYFLPDPKLSFPTGTCYVIELFLMLMSPLELCFDLFLITSWLFVDINFGIIWFDLEVYVEYKFEFGANPEDEAFF